MKKETDCPNLCEDEFGLVGVYISSKKGLFRLDGTILIADAFPTKKKASSKNLPSEEDIKKAESMIRSEPRPKAKMEKELDIWGS